MAAQVDAAKCNGCGACVRVCPPKAIEIKDDTAVIDETICPECGNCVEVCRQNAVSLPNDQ